MAAISMAAGGDIEGLARLHTNNVNLNDGDYDLRTPLHLASAGGQIEVVKFLLKCKVNINLKDRWGATPLNDASTNEMKLFL